MKTTCAMAMAGLLLLAGRTRSLAAGWDLAAGVIDSGRASAKLAALTA